MGGVDRRDYSFDWVLLRLTNIQCAFILDFSLKSYTSIYWYAFAPIVWVMTDCNLLSFKCHHCKIDLNEKFCMWILIQSWRLSCLAQGYLCYLFTHVNCAFIN